MTEKELIEGCILKDAKSQRRLFDEYAGKWMAVCRRYAGDQREAEDILQEAFIRIFSHIGQYRFEGPFEGWMGRIVVNTALQSLQRKKIRFAEIHEEEEPFLAVNAEILTRLDTEELLKLINRLPDGYRIVFNLYVIEGYDHNEISTLLRISPGTSRSQLAKARKLLQTQIDNLIKLPKRYA